MVLERRSCLRLAAGTAAAMALAPQLAGGAEPPPAKRNVLFIAVDDLRPELGCYGAQRVSSPNIDRLAARGLVFERAFCQQAVCSPSRTSLLTGCRPDTTRIYDLETHFRKTLPDVVTLPQHFKANGYHTQAFGKIFHGGLDDSRSWTEPTWQPKGVDWYRLPENRKLMDQLTSGLKDDDARIDAVRRGSIRGAPTECADVPDDAYSDGVIADKTIAALREHKGRPFFLAAGFHKPHLPFVAPKKYWDMYKREDLKLAADPRPPSDFPAIAGTSWGELRRYHGIPGQGPLSDDEARLLIHGYLACISYVDAQIGRVVDELDRLGLAENTVIVLWGDHGWKLGEHGMWCKHTNFELDTRAPLICVAPGGAAGRKTRALVEFVDIYPALCELAGLDKPAHLEGTSFAPLMKDPDRAWKTAAFSQYPRGKVMGYSIRTDRWRYTEWREPDGKVKARELYDHQNDPDENRCLAGQPGQAAVVKELAGKLRAGWQAARPENEAERGAVSPRPLPQEVGRQ